MIDPRTSELCDQFADQYAALRKNKGVTVEQADEIIHDDSYFGTLLVYNGIVDGMVSGAAHTLRALSGLLRDHPDRAGCLHGVQHVPDVPVGSGAGVRRLLDRPGARRPNSPPISRSARRAPPHSSASSRGWPCCPIP